MVRWVSVPLVCGAALACAGAPGGARDERPARPRVARAEDDPLPFVPPPAGTPTTDAPALAVSLESRPVVDVARRALRALLERDTAAIEATLAARLVLAPGSRFRLERSAILERLGQLAPGEPFEGGAPLDRALDGGSWTVAPLAARLRAVAVAGLDPSDVVVTVSVRPEATAFFQRVLGSATRLSFVVRPGAEPPVVGLYDEPRAVRLP